MTVHEPVQQSASFRLLQVSTGISFTLMAFLAIVAGMLFFNDEGASKQP